MTEPFRVPEPSDAAIASAVNDPSWRGNRLSYSTVHAAYTVDVPTIVKAEVERALVEQSLATGVHPSIRDWRDKYLAARFPEAAPVPTIANLHGSVPKLTGGKGSVEYVRETRDKCQCEGLVHVEGCPYRPTPSAPAETHCGMSNDGEDTSRCTLPFAHSGLCQRPKDDGTTCAKCGERTGHLPWCEYNRVPSAAGARPKAGAKCLHEGPEGYGGLAPHVRPLCTLPEGHAGAHQRDLGKPWPNTSCIACLCARCQVEREFVRAWAKVVAYHAHECSWWQNFGGPKHPATVAARRVVEAK